MKILQSAEAKARFSALIKEVQGGNEVVIACGRKKEAVAVIVSYERWKKGKKRQLGTLKGKAEVRFAGDFAMTDGELVYP